ncbi:hypothetical protein GGU11DRAFT_828233 [Lentinula aff. detonsa]|nr:hypothetical protein GGU11DRAFT_828233 [Lentinula aff. detonsa]
MSSSMSHFPNASNFNVYGGNYIQNTIVNTDTQKDPPEYHQGLTFCPIPTNTFTGREEALTKLEGFFDPGRSAERTKVFLLYGLGGVGKTQLALEFASRFMQRSIFSVIFFITADQEDSIQRSYLDIAKNSKDKNPQNWEGGLNWLKAHKKNWLVVIDNADDPKIPFEKYLPSCYHGNVIITSRNPDLEVYSNQSLELKGMPAEEGIQLLAKYAMKGMKEIRDEEQEKAAEIAKELHYFPLALVHAGAYINNQHSLSQDLSGYLDRLRKQKQREQLLNNGPRQSKDGYFQSVYETWKISWEQLSPDSQTFLGLLAHLHYENIPHELFKRAARNLDMAESPLGPSNAVTEGKAILERIALDNIMDDAVSYSLISINKERQEYTFHPLVHQWLKDIDKDSHRQAIEGIVVLAVGEKPQKGHWWDYEFFKRLAPHVRAFGDSFTGDYVVKLAIGCIWNRLHHYCTAINMWEPLLDIMIERLGLEDSLTLYLEHRIVEAYYKPLRRWDKLLGLQQKLMGISKKVLGDKHPATLERKHALVCTLISAGKTNEALKLQQSLLESSKEVLGEEDFNTWDETEKLTEILLLLGKTNEALELVKGLLETVKRVWREEEYYTLVRTGNLVRILQKTGRINEALELMQSLLKVFERVLEKHLSYISTLDRTFSELVAELEALGRTDEVLGLEQSLLEISKRFLGEEHLDTMRITLRVVQILRVLGRTNEVLRLEQSLLEVSKRVLEQANAYNDLALSLFMKLAVELKAFGRTDEALGLEQSILETSKRFLGEEHLSTLCRTQDLAETLLMLGRTNEALELEQGLLETVKRVLGEKDPIVLIGDWFLRNTVNRTQNLVKKLRVLGRTNEALELEQSLLETSKRVLGEGHPHTLSMTQKLVEILRVLGRTSEALQLEQSLLETLKRAPGKQRSNSFTRDWFLKDTVSGTQNLAETLRVLGRTNEALELEQSLLETSKRVLGEEHPDTLSMTQNLAETLSMLGRTNEVLELEQSLLEISKRVLGEEHPDTLIMTQNLAETLLMLGRTNEVLELEQSLLETSKRVLGEEHPNTNILDILRELAVKLRPLGRTDEALGLEQSLLEPSKRVLEEEHPHTDILSIIQNLTETLRASGRTDEAFIDHRLISERIQNLSTILAYLGRKNESLELMNALVDHSVEVLGETHPDTLCYIENLKLLESFTINGYKSGTSHLFPLAFLLLLVLGLYSKGYTMLSFIVQTLFQTL